MNGLTSKSLVSYLLVLTVIALAGCRDSGGRDECGDGACTGDETNESCPEDCAAGCGDGLCDGDETAESCPADCASPCGDGRCMGGETFESCPEDCSESCGNGSCDAGENPTSCPADCQSLCGDGSCTAGENSDNCPDDCPPGCGDGRCDDDEDALSCPLDCDMRCGDGACSHTENAGNCPEDCPVRCGDGFCTEPEEDAASCPDDCPGVCGDDACTHDEIATCPEDCCTQSIEGTVTIDVPRVEVTFQITVGGETLTNRTGEEYISNVYSPYVTLTNVDAPGDSMRIYTHVLTDESEGYDWTLMPNPLTRWLVPGSYQVTYSAGTRSIFQNWPINSGAPIGEPLELTTSGVVTIDIPRVEETFELTVGGEALTNMTGEEYISNVYSPYVTLTNEGAPGDSMRIYTHVLTEDSEGYDWTLTPNSLTRWLVPGSYQVTYSAGTRSIFQNWPINSSAPIGEPRALSSSGTVTIDIPRIEETFVVTVGGEAITDMTGEEYISNVYSPYVTLTNDGAPGDSMRIYTHVLTDESEGYDWTLTPNSLTRWLVPGSYQVTYSAGTRSIFQNWPINSGAPIGDPRALSSSGTVTIDIPRVEETFVITVGGEAITDMTGEEYISNVYSPYVTLTNDGAPGDSMRIYTHVLTDESEGYDWTLVPNSLSRWLVPGSYQVTYSAGTRSIFQNWPINSGAPIGDPRALSASGTVTIDIPRVEETFVITVGGEALTDMTGEEYISNVYSPYVTLTNEGAPGDSMRIYTHVLTEDSEGYDWTLIPNSLTRWLVPGSYQVTYSAGTRSIFQNWPINSGAPIGDPRALSASGTVTIDIPRIEETFVVTVGGEALTDMTGEEYISNVYSPYVTLINANAPGDTMRIYTHELTDESEGYDWTLVPNSLTRWLIPGSYSLTYSAGTRSIFSDWPINNGAPIGCAYFSL